MPRSRAAPPRAAPPDPALTAKHREVAVAICRAVYPSGQCACATRPDLPACTTMINAGAAAASAWVRVNN